MNKVTTIALYLVGLIAAGLIGWQLAQKPAESNLEGTAEILATVNDHPIEKAWFIEQMKLRGGEKPGQYHTIEQKQALLKYLINQEVLYLKAVEYGADKDPAIDRMFKKAVIDKYLTDTLNDKLDDVFVNTSEIRNHFDENKESYDKPARRRAAVIYASKPEGASEEALKQKRSRVEKALNDVSELDEKTLHFGALATKYSDDRASMYQGGVIGWFINHPDRKYKWDQKIIDQLFSLQDLGDISPILETDDGYYLVRLVAAEQVKEKSFDLIKNGIERQLLQQKKKQLQTDFMQANLEDANIDIDQQMLADIKPLSGIKQPKNAQPPALPSSGGAK